MPPKAKPKVSNRTLGSTADKKARIPPSTPPPESTTADVDQQITEATDDPNNHALEVHPEAIVKQIEVEEDLVVADPLLPENGAQNNSGGSDSEGKPQNKYDDRNTLSFRVPHQVSPQHHRDPNESSLTKEPAQLQHNTALKKSYAAIIGNRKPGGRRGVSPNAVSNPGIEGFPRAEPGERRSTSRGRGRASPTATPSQATTSMGSTAGQSGPTLHTISNKIKSVLADAIAYVSSHPHEAEAASEAIVSLLNDGAQAVKAQKLLSKGLLRSSFRNTGTETVGAPKVPVANGTENTSSARTFAASNSKARSAVSPPPPVANKSSITTSPKKTSVPAKSSPAGKATLPAQTNSPEAKPAAAEDTPPSVLLDPPEGAANGELQPTVDAETEGDSNPEAAPSAIQPPSSTGKSSKKDQPGARERLSFAAAVAGSSVKEVDRIRDAARAEERRNEAEARRKLHLEQKKQLQEQTRERNQEAKARREMQKETIRQESEEKMRKAEAKREDENSRKLEFTEKDLTRTAEAQLLVNLQHDNMAMELEEKKQATLAKQEAAREEEKKLAKEREEQREKVLERARDLSQLRHDSHVAKAVEKEERVKRHEASKKAESEQRIQAVADRQTYVAEEKARLDAEASEKARRSQERVEHSAVLREERERRQKEQSREQEAKAKSVRERREREIATEVNQGSTASTGKKSGKKSGSSITEKTTVENAVESEGSLTSKLLLSCMGGQRTAEAICKAHSVLQKAVAVSQKQGKMFAAAGDDSPAEETPRDEKTTGKPQAASGTKKPQPQPKESTPAVKEPKLSGVAQKHREAFKTALKIFAETSMDIFDTILGEADSKPTGKEKSGSKITGVFTSEVTATPQQQGELNLQFMGKLRQAINDINAALDAANTAAAAALRSTTTKDQQPAQPSQGWAMGVPEHRALRRFFPLFSAVIYACRKNGTGLGSRDPDNDNQNIPPALSVITDPATLRAVFSLCHRLVSTCPSLSMFETLRHRDAFVRSGASAAAAIIVADEIRAIATPGTGPCGSGLIGKLLPVALSCLHAAAHHVLIDCVSMPWAQVHRASIPDLLQATDVSTFACALAATGVAVGPSPATADGATPSTATDHPAQHHLPEMAALQYALMMLLLQLRLHHAKFPSPQTAPSAQMFDDKNDWATNALHSMIACVTNLFLPHGQAPKPEATLPPVATTVLLCALRICNMVTRRRLDFAQNLLCETTFGTEFYHMVAAFVAFIAGLQERVALEKIDPMQSVPNPSGALLPAALSGDALNNVLLKYPGLRDSATDAGKSFIDALNAGLTLHEVPRPTVNTALPISALAPPAQAPPKGVPANMSSLAGWHLRSALHELLIFCGYVSVNNAKVQDLFGYGAKNTNNGPLLSLLVQCLPVSYFGIFRHVAMPTLLSICHGHRRNFLILSNDVDAGQLRKFLLDSIQAREKNVATKETAAGPNKQVPPKSGVMSPNPTSMPSWADIEDSEEDSDDVFAAVFAQAQNAVASEKAAHVAAAGESVGGKKAGGNISHLPYAAFFRVDRRFSPQVWEAALADLNKAEEMAAAHTTSSTPPIM